MYFVLASPTIKARGGLHCDEYVVDSSETKSANHQPDLDHNCQGLCMNPNPLVDWFRGFGYTQCSIGEMYTESERQPDPKKARDIKVLGILGLSSNMSGKNVPGTEYFGAFRFTYSTCSERMDQADPDSQVERYQSIAEPAFSCAV
jgi:hypothetical protein